MNRTYNALYRWIHWGIALGMMAMLLTIVLRLTWLNKHNVSSIIQTYITEKGIELSEDETIVLAKKIRKPMWQWHIYTGYYLTFLFALRFTLPFFGQMKFMLPWQKGLTNKERLQFGSYLAFYVFVTMSLTTGLLIEFGNQDWRQALEDVHKLSIYYLVAYIAVHFAGVLWAEWKTHPGIISRIYGGRN